MNREIESKPPREITDPTAKKWYDEGFRFAINYVYAIMPELGDDSFDWETFKTFDRETFKKFLATKLVEGVDEKYFDSDKHPFSPDIYPVGMCPGDRPGTCIQCPDNAIKAVEPKKRP